MQSPPRPRAERSPAPAQSGSGCLGRNVAGEAPSLAGRSGAWASSALLWPKRSTAKGSYGQRAGRRRSLLWGDSLGIWETLSGELSSVLSCTVQGRHCCTGVGWLEVLQKIEGARMQKTGTKTRRDVSFSTTRKES